MHPFGINNRGNWDMNNIQKIINVCLAIIISFLTYQNIQLKEEIGTIKGFSQLTVDKAWERLDLISGDLETLRDAHNKVAAAISKNVETINALIEDSQRQDKNIDILEENDQLLQKNIIKIEDYIIENFSGKPR